MNVFSNSFFFFTGVNKHVSSCRLSSFLATHLLQIETLGVGHCDAEGAHHREVFIDLQNATNWSNQTTRHRGDFQMLARKQVWQETTGHQRKRRKYRVIPMLTPS